MSISNPTIFKSLKLEDLISQKIHPSYFYMMELLADYCHDTQYRILTGEPYSKHLLEVGELGKKTAKSNYGNFLKHLFMLHDYNEDLQGNKERDNAHKVRQGSILSDSYGDLGIFSAQYIRLMNRKRMQNYLQDIGVISDDSSKAEKFRKSVISLTGKWGYPNLEDLAYQANTNISVFLVSSKMFDMASNMDMNKTINENFMRERYSRNIHMQRVILLDDVKDKKGERDERKIETAELYVKALRDKFFYFKERNCRRVIDLYNDLNIFLLDNDLFTLLFDAGKFSEECEGIYEYAERYIQSIFY